MLQQASSHAVFTGFIYDKDLLTIIDIGISIIDIIGMGVLRLGL